MNNIEQLNDDWEILNVTVDSGAVDNVLNKECASQIGTKETNMSRSGGYYTVANDTRTYNEGERVIRGYLKDGKPAEMTFQVCDVNGPTENVQSRESGNL